jgi:phage repressor protein C with HTH and peptisase S24 domain
MPEEESIQTRLEALIRAAGSQKALARVGKVSDGTLINWLRRLGLRESKLREAAKNLGVSFLWLRDGAGDSEAELAKFKARLKPQIGGSRGTLTIAREQAGLSVGQLAKLTRYPANILQQVEDGSIRASQKFIEAVCAHLPTLTPEDLMSGSDDAPIMDESGTTGTYGATPTLKLPPGMTGRYVPLLSMAEAGPFDAGHGDGLFNHTGVFAPNVDDRRAFALKVSGNSMEPAMSDGDIVVCSPEKELANGIAAVIRTHSEQVFIKFWNQSGKRVVLESANPAYKPIQFPVEEIAGAWAVVQRFVSGTIKKQL